jgi:hypothetical protein
MNLPESLEMRNTLHGHGAKGMAIYGYDDASGLGVRMEARRKDGRSPFIETWFFDALPGREFATYAALREAVLPMSEAQIRSETADKYPLIREAEPDPCGNPCRLCPRPPYVPGQDRQKHETWRVTLAYSWKDVHPCSLCDDHYKRFAEDPNGLRDALAAEVAERIARADARRLAEQAPQQDDPKAGEK